MNMETDKKEWPKLPVIERKIVPAIREGIELVMMIVFMKLRERNAKVFPDRDEVFHSMLAAATLNRIFGSQSKDEKVRSFVAQNDKEIKREVDTFRQNFDELRIMVTDALRMQFVCDEVEGIGSTEENRAVLENAAKKGILMTERDAPLPKGFMNLVYRVGLAHGLIKPQKNDQPEEKTVH